MTWSDTTRLIKFVDARLQEALSDSMHDTDQAKAVTKLSQSLGFSSLRCLEMKACFALRHAYFVQERGWVSANHETPGLEIDHYDPHVVHLGVWQGESLRAYLRLLPFDPRIGFMLDHELSALLSPQERDSLPRENAVEISRLVCQVSQSDQDGQGSPRPGDPRLMELLFKQLYQVSLERGFTRFYIVVEVGWLRLFARRFGVPFQIIGAPYRFPDGTRTVAATATLEELEAGMRRHSEAKYRWYCQAGENQTEDEEAI